jgi:hypothetical protein
MAGRKTEIVKVPANFGRDAGKHFLLTEWSARKADHWAIRAMLAYNRGGGDMSAEALLGRGMEAIFFVEEVTPILDELLECVQMIRDPAARDRATGMPVATPLVSDDDIEEIKTVWWLRSEVIRQVVGFSPLEIAERWVSRIMKPQALESTST